MVKELMTQRAQIKKKKPTYKRVQDNQYARFKKDSKWRRPKGTGNKSRLNKRGHTGMLKEGYKSPKQVRGFNKAGFKEVVVANISDLAKVTQKHEIAVISSTVGGKKKLEILKECKAKNIAIANVKNIDNSIKSLTKEKKTKEKKEVKKQVSKEEVSEEQSTSKKATDKKAEDKQ